MFGKTFGMAGRDPQVGGFAAKDRGILLHHLRIRFHNEDYGKLSLWELQYSFK
jgi:hypothetical protein